MNYLLNATNPQLKNPASFFCRLFTEPLQEALSPLSDALVTRLLVVLGLLHEFIHELYEKLCEYSFPFSLNWFFFVCDLCARFMYFRGFPSSALSCGDTWGCWTHFDLRIYIWPYNFPFVLGDCGDRNKR